MEGLKPNKKTIVSLVILYFLFHMMRIVYPHTGRKLKQLITGLLKSWLVQEVQRMNYVKSYTLVDGKISNQEIKLVELMLKDEHKEKVEKMIAKNWPEAKLVSSIK